MFNGASAWVRRAETSELRGYAEQKKGNCVGTQSRNRRTAWVRRAAVVQVRTHSKSTRRDSLSECVITVAVRGATVYLGAYCTQHGRRSSAWARGAAEGNLRVYVGKQKVKCVATQARERKIAYLSHDFLLTEFFFLLIRCSGFSSVLFTAVDWVIYL